MQLTCANFYHINPLLLSVSCVLSTALFLLVFVTFSSLLFNFMAARRLAQLCRHLQFEEASMSHSRTISSLQSIALKNTTLSVGETIEFYDNRNANSDTDFLKVRGISYNRNNGRVTLRGQHYKRTRNSAGLLPARLNELFLVCPKANPDSSEPVLDQAIRNIDLVSEACFNEDEPIKRELIVTNKEFPEASFRERIEGESDFLTDEKKAEVEQSGLLVCRWAIVAYEQEGEVAEGRLAKAVDVRRISGVEADAQHGIPDWQNIENWRGHIPQDDTDKKVTFGDGFCGAGGVSIGATQAGLDVKFGFDHNGDAISTFGLNNATAYTWNCDVNQFISMCKQLHEEFQVDILHVSPPCQAWSRQNQRAGLRDPASDGGRRDEANQAASFGIAELLRQCKPRYGTMEQTSGILDTKYTDFFRAIVRQYTSQGFSVSWRLLDLAKFGVPQHRRRVIIVAACPGSALPAWPEPTHGPDHIFPYCTVNDYIRDIDEEHTHHEPCPALVGEAWSGDDVLRSLIDTRGTNTLHPSGRAFTVRELAALMTLPLEFQFPAWLGNSVIKRQIGNMVPACFADTLLRALKKAMKDENCELIRAKQIHTDLQDFQFQDTAFPLGGEEIVID